MLWTFICFISFVHIFCNLIQTEVGRKLYIKAHTYESHAKRIRGGEKRGDKKGRKDQRKSNNFKLSINLKMQI